MSTETGVYKETGGGDILTRDGWFTLGSLLHFTSLHFKKAQNRATGTSSALGQLHPAVPVRCQ